MSVRIYVEGGGQGTTKADCRLAFRCFLEKIIPPKSFSVIASGSRRSAFEDFCDALGRHPNDYVILLVDSEAPVATNSWHHLNEPSGDLWVRPTSAEDDQAQLMVQTMESWFLADKQVLIKYYGKGFLVNSLPGQQNIELVPKQDVLNRLKHASAQTQKGKYHRTVHGFDILSSIDPGLVRAASTHAERLFAMLARETAR